MEHLLAKVVGIEKASTSLAKMKGIGRRTWLCPANGGLRLLLTLGMPLLEVVSAPWSFGQGLSRGNPGRLLAEMSRNTHASAERDPLILLWPAFEV